jgi:TRAP-type C4-dicarboxylate transport system substrate-binding protein
VAALVLQWHTKVKYITQLPVSYSMGVFAIEKDTFGKLTPGDQQIVREVMVEYMSELDRAAREDNRRAAEVLASSGLETVSVDARDVEGWRQTIESVYPRLRERPDMDAAMFDKLFATLADYRRAHPEPAR